MRLDYRTFDAHIYGMLTPKGKYRYRTDNNFRKHYRDILVDVTTLVGKRFFNMQRKYVFAMQDIHECRTLHELKRWYKEYGVKGNHPYVKEAKERIKKSRGIWSN